MLTAPDSQITPIYLYVHVNLYVTWKLLTILLLTLEFSREL